jgi:hypothetical protein
MPPPIKVIINMQTKKLISHFGQDFTYIFDS